MDTEIKAMTKSGDDGQWIPAMQQAGGPVYLAIADALEADILSGGLATGTRLPPQRHLAERLGIDFTTVSRAYSEAKRRGLVDGRVGLGTFVRAQSSVDAKPPRESGEVDMSMNLPPEFDDAGLTAHMWASMSALGAQGCQRLLMRYQEPGGTAQDRETGAQWLSPRLGQIPIDRLLVCAGAQGALLAVASSLAAPGDTICTEALTYPGFRSLAAHAGIKLAGVTMDDEGIDPDSFDEACEKHAPKALYCTPTLHNPTTATMPLKRREALIAVARKRRVPIIEDDAYGALAVDAPPPLAGLAPDIVYYVGGLAKCLSPALRVAYLVAPDARTASKLAGALRATASTASPLTSALASRWILDGTATSVLHAIRAETAARQAIASGILPPGLTKTNLSAYHLWLPLAEPWGRGEFASRLRTKGISVVASDAFALSSPPEAVRLGLGAASSREELARSLQIAADLLLQQPAMSLMVV
jgi:DNA-binding transcriptional MocR family regulator